MRFRLPDWDVAMPEALVAYWTAWNTRDLDQVRGLLDRAVIPEVEWNDPRDSFVGIDELERAMRRLRSSKPNYEFSIASELDCHHGRFRYRWDMSRNGRRLMEGLDIVTITESGLIERVDGFFGQPTPIKDVGSGVPAPLRSGSG
jgi:SnoaL-like domain